MANFEAGSVIWRNGWLEKVDPTSALHLPLLSQALDYSRSAISGIRITPHHAKENTLLIFCLEDHMRRLLDTCGRIGLETQLTVQELCHGAVEVARTNGGILRRGGYMRAIAYDARQMVAPQYTGPAEIIIFAGPFGEYVPAGEFRITFDDFLRTGVQREAKASANYLGFAAARRRVHPLKMNDVIGVTPGQLGKLVIGEGTTSNFFISLNGSGIYTAPLEAGILAGITRMKVIELAREMDYQVEDQKHIPLSIIPMATEMFFTGTASYVIPVTRFGIHPLKTEIGKKLNRMLRLVMVGAYPDYQHWNTEVLIETA